MASEKSFLNEQRIALLRPGPLVKFNPLNPGWSVLAPFTGAWAEYHPLTGRVYITASMATDGTHASDNYEIAKLPQYDGDPRFPPNGNLLWPAQGAVLHLDTNVMQTGSTPRTPALHIGPGGSMTTFGIAAATTRADCYASYPVAQL